MPSDNKLRPDDGPGSEEHLVAAATIHAGHPPTDHEDTPQLRDDIRPVAEGRGRQGVLT